MGLGGKREGSGRKKALLPTDETAIRIRTAASLFPTDREYAVACEVAYSTWQKFKKEHKEFVDEAIEDGRGAGKLSLRRRQVQMSEKSAAMAIFLGKQYLGQTDERTIRGTGPGGSFPVFDLSRLSDDELKWLHDIIEKVENPQIEDNS